MNCTCPEDPNLYLGTICDCIFCEIDIRWEEKTNKPVCRRCYCDKKA